MGFGSHIDSPSMDVQELADVLNRLVSLKKAQTSRWRFLGLVRVLDQVSKVNPHQHITGSIGGRDLLRLVVRIYRQDCRARQAFLDYLESRQLISPGDRDAFLDQPDNDLLRWFKRHIPLGGTPESFREADDRLSLVRLAFQSSHEDAIGLLGAAYRSVALENAASGVSEVWFRTSLGDHHDGSFFRAALAAQEGAKQAESETDRPLQVRFLVGARKCLPDGSARHLDRDGSDSDAVGLVQALDELRRTVPGTRAAFIGIDSVGPDGDWEPAWQASARQMAARNGLRVAMHFAESWKAGCLVPTLQRLKSLVSQGVIDQLDNANALFAVKDHKSKVQHYSDADWRTITDLQCTIFSRLAARGIVLGINPTSNDLLTRSLREQEGWRFRRLDEPVDSGLVSLADLMQPQRNGPSPLLLLVGNDNSRIYPSRVAGSSLTVSEELANLWAAAGSSFPSVYGKLSTATVAQFILNGFAAARAASQRAHGSEPPPQTFYLERDFTPAPEIAPWETLI